MNYVYFIRAKGTNYFKIGFTSTSPEKRLKELQTGCPHTLEIYKVIKSPLARTIETTIHCQYKKYKTRDNGEWFTISKSKANKIYKRYKVRRRCVMKLIRTAVIIIAFLIFWTIYGQHTSIGLKIKTMTGYVERKKAQVEKIVTEIKDTVNDAKSK